MIVCIVGTVTDVTGQGFSVEDKLTKEVFECTSNNSDFLDMDIGTEAIFVGRWYKGTLKVDRREIRKFLDPLYEQELLETAAFYTLVPIINDPFGAIYNELRLKDESIKDTTEVS